MELRTITPGESVSGQIIAPGDKSISHRALMLAAIAEGDSVIRGLSTAHDVQSTIDCLRQLGIEIQEEDFAVVVKGKGRHGLSAPGKILNAGNSGTTIRLLSGILAGQPFATTIDGDASLRRRPMNRIIQPLRQMGATILCPDVGTAPLTLRGGRLSPLSYEMTVASAQVKSAILLAGLYAAGRTSVIQPAVCRDHTERMLRFMGVEVESKKNTARMKPGRLSAKELTVPSDFSSAIFFMCAAFMLAGSELTLRKVGINPTRSYALKVLRRAGAHILIEDFAIKNNEEIADLSVRTSKLQAFNIKGGEIPLVIDEIPVLAVLATQANGVTRIRDAKELRIKETDRIRAICENLKRMGGKVAEFDDGFDITGPVKLKGAQVDSFGDHRIAMAFTIAGLAAEGETRIQNAEAADVSFPEFYDMLEGVTRQKL